ncbi:MAG: MMPL family transporter, partial [Actinomycetota bacterium]|nr:MMPL family transporter [Actinomycetota bacterium]
AGAEARRAGDLLREEFSGDESAMLTVVLPETGAEQLGDYTAALGRVPGVVDVQVVPSASGSYVRVLPEVSPNTPAGDGLVRALRAEPSPGPTLVTGSAAAGLDAKLAVGARLPWALGFIAVATLLLLFAFTGSVVLPVKALALNLLSLSATFGAMVWVFQEGHLSGLLGFTSTGTLELGVPVLMFCVAFGLSMDYEVFLLSRIKEVYAATGDNTLAVARGLQRTGAIITAAAGLLAVVFIAFAFSGVTTIKLLGLGIALAVVMDATLVRGLLVPAVMRLAGEWNWWAPAPLRRLHERFGLHEAQPAQLDGERGGPTRELVGAAAEASPAAVSGTVQ